MSTQKPDSPDRALARILGPAEPEVSCEECFARLDRYVELELAGADAEAAHPGMRAHFEGCSACAEDRESLRALLAGQNPRNSPEAAPRVHAGDNQPD